MKYNKSGFTLIEITIALMVLAVGLVGILTLFPVGFDAAGRANKITIATFLAQEKMEEIKRDGYDAAIALDGDYSSFMNYTNFEYEIDVLDGIDDPDNGRMLLNEICEVTVNLYWPASAGAPGSRDNQRDVELKTYIADYD